MCNNTVPYEEQNHYHLKFNDIAASLCESGKGGKVVTWKITTLVSLVELITQSQSDKVNGTGVSID